MRKLIPALILLVTLGLAVACDAVGLGDAPKCEEKTKEPQKVSAAEIEQLIKNLSSTDYLKRELAAKQLLRTPSALRPLRRSLVADGLSLEARRRIEPVIDELARAAFKLRLEALAKQKADAPVDLLLDVMLENRNYVTKDEWKLLVETVGAIGTKLAGPNKYKQINIVPNKNCDYTKCEEFIGKELLFDVGRYRVIADKFRPIRPIEGSVLLLSESFGRHGAYNSIVLVRGPRPRGEMPFQNDPKLSCCFVFCDDDIHCESVSGSVVIATGTVQRAGASAYNIVIEDARKSSLVKLFSPADIGLDLVFKKGQIRVRNVAAGSRAAKAGLKPGDAIVASKKSDDPLTELMRDVRRHCATGADIELRVQRRDYDEKITLSFED
jgi:PDZ domain